MKKIVLLSVSFLLVSCSATPKVEETIEPTITPEIMEDPLPRVGSKINMGLYPTETYYPVVDGVVTYPDGTTEEFNHGLTYEVFSGEDCFYETFGTKQWVQEEIKYLEDVHSGKIYDDIMMAYDIKALETGLYLYVAKEKPSTLTFAHNSIEKNEIIDGVFGIEYTSPENKIYPYVVYRYSTAVPEGYEINDALRITVDEKVFYLWRFKEFDNMYDLEELFNLGYTSQDVIINWRQAYCTNWLTEGVFDNE